MNRRMTWMLVLLVEAACGAPATQVREGEPLLGEETVARPPAETAGIQATAEGEGVRTESIASVPASEPTSASVPTSVASPVSEANTTEVKAAVELIKNGQTDEGRERLQNVLRTDPSSALANYNLAVMEYSAGDTRAAELHAQKAMELSNGSQKATKLYDTIMQARGQADQARPVYERLLERVPDSLPVLNALARAKISMGKAPEALRDASQLLKRDEANLEVMKTIARAYLAMERIEAAEMVLKQTLELGKDAEVLNMLGHIAARQGDNQKAIGLFQQALSQNSGLADARNNLGVLYHLAGDYEGAIRELQTAVQLSPGYAIAYMNLGNAYRKSMDFKAAVDAYNSALKLDSGCADCYFNLGLASLENRGTGKDESGHYRRAMEYLKRYKDMRRGGKGDDADKYLDEARRMAEALEKEERARPATPAEGGGAQ